MHLLGVRSDELPWLLRVRLRVRTVWCRRRTLYRVLHHGVLLEMFPPEVREPGFRRFGDVSTHGASIKKWHATCSTIILRACSINDGCVHQRVHHQNAPNMRAGSHGRLSCADEHAQTTSSRVVGQ